MSKTQKESQNLSPLFKLRNYILDNWREDKSYFLGQVLTIIDAGIADKEQRKAMKNLVSNAFYSNRNQEDEALKIIMSFAEKFARHTLPETNEDRDLFFLRSHGTWSTNPNTNPGYFTEYKIAGKEN